MQDVGKVTSSLLTRLDKINFLVASPGFASLKGRDDTEEGLDRKLAVNFYGRFKFINELLLKLESAAAIDENAKVLTVLAAGRRNGVINLKDIGLVKNYSLSGVANAGIAYTNAAITVRLSFLFLRMYHN